MRTWLICIIRTDSFKPHPQGFILLRENYFCELNNLSCGLKKNDDGNALLIWWTCAPFLSLHRFFHISIALASSGTIPITSLDGSNLLFANTSAGNTPNLVTTPLFLNPQNLSLLTSNPVSLVSPGMGGLQVTADGHHQVSTAAVPVQASTITTAPKAQWSQSGCISN